MYQSSYFVTNKYNFNLFNDIESSNMTGLA
eukprot:UN04252